MVLIDRFIDHGHTNRLRLSLSGEDRPDSLVTNCFIQEDDVLVIEPLQGRIHEGLLGKKRIVDVVAPVVCAAEQCGKYRGPNVSWVDEAILGYPRERIGRTRGAYELAAKAVQRRRFLSAEGVLSVRHQAISGGLGGS